MIAQNTLNSKPMIPPLHAALMPDVMFLSEAVFFCRGGGECLPPKLGNPSILPYVSTSIEINTGKITQKNHQAPIDLLDK